MNKLAEWQKTIELIRSLPPLQANAIRLGSDDAVTMSRAAWLGRCRAATTPIQHPRLAIFAGAGDVALDASLKDCLESRGAVCEVAEALDMDLRLYELPARHADDALEALAYGMMAVEPGVEIIALCAPSPVHGDQLNPRTLEEVVRHAPTAAIAGAITAARLANIPCILDGTIALEAASSLCGVNPKAADHCLASWHSTYGNRAHFRSRTGIQFVPPLVGDETTGLDGALQLAEAMELSDRMAKA